MGRKGLLAVVLATVAVLSGGLAAHYYTWNISYAVNPLEDHHGHENYKDCGQDSCLPPRSSVPKKPKKWRYFGLQPSGVGGGFGRR